MLNRSVIVYLLRFEYLSVSHLSFFTGETVCYYPHPIDLFRDVTPTLDWTTFELFCHASCFYSAIPPAEGNSSFLSETPELSSIPSAYHDLERVLVRIWHCLSPSP